MVRTGRSTIFFDLLDACTRDGCPICRLVSRSVERFFDALSYENTNDPAIRAQLRASRGFCNRHAWQYAARHDGLGTAIIYRDILRDVLRSATKGRDEPIKLLTRAAEHLLTTTDNRDRDRLLKAIAPRRGCMVCTQEEATSRHAVDALLRRLEEPGVCAALTGSAGLCQRHLLVAITLAREPVQREHVTQAQRAAWTRLCDRVAAGDPSAAAAALVGNEQVA
jgi:hypothetical protein